MGRKALSGARHATGATAFYDGSRFARDGVVCVTINYRVGVEGFLYLADGIANLGLLDQIAALEWVRENIATLGGDSGQGHHLRRIGRGMSVATLLTMPRAKRVFRRAIVQAEYPERHLACNDSSDRQAAC